MTSKSQWDGPIGSRLDKVPRAYWAMSLITCINVVCVCVCVLQSLLNMEAFMGLTEAQRSKLVKLLPAVDRAGPSA